MVTNSSTPSPNSHTASFRRCPAHSHTQKKKGKTKYPTNPSQWSLTNISRPNINENIKYFRILKARECARARACSKMLVQFSPATTPASYQLDWFSIGSPLVCDFRPCSRPGQTPDLLPIPPPPSTSFVRPSGLQQPPIVSVHFGSVLPVL